MAHNSTNITNTSTVHNSVHVSGRVSEGMSNPAVEVNNTVGGDTELCDMLLTPPRRQFFTADRNPRSPNTDEMLRANDHGRQPYTKSMVFGLGHGVDPRTVLSHAAAVERHGEHSFQAHVAAAREETGKRRITQFMYEGGCSPVGASAPERTSRTAFVDYSPDYGTNAEKQQFDTPRPARGDARYEYFGPPAGPKRVKGAGGGFFGTLLRQSQPSGYMGRDDVTIDEDSTYPLYSKPSAPAAARASQMAGGLGSKEHSIDLSAGDMPGQQKLPPLQAAVDGDGGQATGAAGKSTKGRGPSKPAPSVTQLKAIARQVRQDKPYAQGRRKVTVSWADCAKKCSWAWPTESSLTGAQCRKEAEKMRKQVDENSATVSFQSGSREEAMDSELRRDMELMKAEWDDFEEREKASSAKEGENKENITVNGEKGVQAADTGLSQPKGTSTAKPNTKVPPPKPLPFEKSIEFTFSAWAQTQAERPAHEKAMKIMEFQEAERARAHETHMAQLQLEMLREKNKSAAAAAAASTTTPAPSNTDTTASDATV